MTVNSKDLICCERKVGERKLERRFSLGETYWSLVNEIIWPVWT